ncbi:MAG: AAA family ATPase, partial [Planctomycetota bacterium]
MADSHGVTLRHVMESGESSIDRLLLIATKIADTLQRIHEQGIIHQDITPDSLVVFGPHDDVQLIDFRCSAMLAVEDPIGQMAGRRRATPMYMSPEQTGRTNRLLDSRSDLYSLGVTLYEAFVGAPPFQTNDLLEIIHAHLAKQPTAPDDLNAALPKSLSGILLKLLAKSSEERYQTAFGLKKDLERCLACYESDPDSTFELGAEDDRSQMRLPRRLYGRETAMRTLLDAFERTRGGGVESVFIAGHSGIGKTSLVNEVQRSFADSRSHSISGKFDQFNRDIPYQALIAAVRGLIRQVLVADAATVAEFRESVTIALDGNGRVLLDVLPDLELVLSKQPAVPILDPPQARERFRATFLAMLRACATKNRPLVIFLDDVQWADPPTLDLIRALTTETMGGHLLLLLSYRDNEVFQRHPIRRLVADLQEAKAA